MDKKSFFWYNISVKHTKKPEKKPKIHFRQSLFWDVDPKTIHPKRHARYIIERILDFGNDKEVKWMWHMYPRSLIRDVVENSRVIHAPTRSLWTLLTARM